MSPRSKIPSSEKPSGTPQMLASKDVSVEVPKDEKQREMSEESSKLTEVNSDQAQPQPVSFGTLFRFSTNFEIFMNIVGLVAAAGAGAAQPLMSILFGNLTQDFVNFATVVSQSNNGNATATALVPEAARIFKQTAAKDASYLAYMGVGMFVCTYLYMNIWVYTGEVNAKRIRERYLQAILRQDIAFFDNVGAGEVATRIQTDTHLVQLGISEKVPIIITYISSLIAGFVVAYVKEWRLALALTVLLPLLTVTGGVMNYFVVPWQQGSLNHVADGGGFAEEVISTIRTAQAFGSQRVLSRLYNRHIDRALALDLKTTLVTGIALGVFFFMIYPSYALAFFYGTILINQNRASAGDIIAVIMSILVGSFALALMAPEAQAVGQALGAGAKLFDTIDRVPDIDSASEGGDTLPSVTGEVTLDGVDFHYPSRPAVQILKGLSLTFRAGKTTALVGASGSGKSTIVSLVERFYDPVQGSVSLDGHDLKTLNLRWLRSQIGLVSQEPTLFATTIQENVEFGLINTQWENADQEKKFALVKEACVKANADDFISKLPNGYATMVGERGFLLSGGQKQRIAIARAIVSNPKILLLDEATSALDTQSEGIVQDALDKAAAGRTTITIAHRLSTVKNADTIYVMGDGLVLEAGTHSELMNKNGAYARLVHAQTLKERVEGSGATGSQEIVVEEETNATTPRRRRNTARSVASEVLERRLTDTEANKPPATYSMFQLFKRMGLLAKDQWGHYSIGFIAATLTGFVYPAFGLVFAKGIEGFSKPTAPERRHEGDRTALWLFVIALISTVTVGAQNYFFMHGAAFLTARLRSLGFKALLRQDIEYFDRDENNSGTLTAKLSENPQKVNGLAGTTLSAIVQSIATVVLGSVLGLAFIWKIGLVGIACTPLVISAGYVRLRVVVLKDQANKKAHDESAHVACEAAGAIRTVASLTQEAYCLRRYSASLEEPLRNSNRTSIFSNGLYALSQAMSFLVIALVFWYGSVLVANGEATTFQFFVGLMSTTFGAIQAGNVFQFVPDMSSAHSAGSELLKLFDAVPNVDAESEAGKKVEAGAVQGHLKLEDVHFRYPTRPAVPVLRGLSLDVKPGTFVALVGASGCGKSTVIQLLERFYDPLAGDIYLDGEKITDLNVQEYRKMIALVSQEPSLYAGSIRFNILLGAAKPENEVTQEELEEACRKANILEFVQSLPDGFETEVGGKGSQLSGGQKQRIAIARALLRNPKVLLLDEATSALDSNSEKVVQAALDQAAKGRTTIAIAHRLSTIQNADIIYFLKDGKVYEAGTHETLIAKKGAYYEYVQLQTFKV